VTATPRPIRGRQRFYLVVAGGVVAAVAVAAFVIAWIAHRA